MKIRQYIVTYKNSDILNNGLNSIFSNLSEEELSVLEIYIINNHSDFYIKPEFSDKVKVLHNTLRSDFSTGHLARNWNQAIINGFENLNVPACDIVIAGQNDINFKPNYISKLIDLHKKYDLIQFGIGDACISYTPIAIKRIGLWDERFCNIGYQEADYYIRICKYFADRSLISQMGDNIFNFNNTQSLSAEDSIIIDDLTGCGRNDPYHMESSQYHTLSMKILEYKWGGICEEIEKVHQKNPSFVFYPYFEKDVETLQEQNYIGY